MGNPLTVTADAGPAIASDALVINNVTSANYDFTRKVVTIVTSDFPYPKEFDLVGVTTLTITLSAGVYTLVLS